VNGYIHWSAQRYDVVTTMCVRKACSVSSVFKLYAVWLNDVAACHCAAF
jgi:hypothetical protein